MDRKYIGLEPSRMMNYWNNPGEPYRAEGKAESKSRTGQLKPGCENKTNGIKIPFVNSHNSPKDIHNRE